ncbi:MAG TPA: alpha-glucosidase/alpha-galactosidase [Tepidisphaeraceae bacterium]|jgi:alpha-galactosidase|nr:alpha-glucosidase/alpha-galactosidase [Tepidisphaeraceae bacterium]
MIKVAMIGAGSVVFSKNLTGDILGFPEFKDATFSYMDIDEERLQVGADLCRKVGKALGANPKIEATTDRRKALEGADFVINMVQIGGFDSTLVDFEIPRKYGLNFTIADTTGPGGFFRALRTFPMLKGLVTDMMAVCPKATLLNYSNPMSMNMQTITRTSDIRAVGLCHSVQGTYNQLMGYINEKPEDTNFICAGINHMAFYLKMEKDGQSLYPRLFEAMNDPKVYNTNKVRFEMMKMLGHFVTESSEHNAEYSAHFIPHGKDVIQKYDVPIDEYLRRCDGIVDEFERMKTFSKSDEPMNVHRSHEYGSTIIHSIVTNTPSVVYGNMPNNGAISNLPRNAIAEVPTLVDRSGLQFTTVGELPPQLVAYMNPHVTQHELFIRAALEGRRDYIYQAAMFDPLTAATMPMDKIRELCDELIAAHGFEKNGGFLPELDTVKTLVPTSGQSFGKVDPKVLRKSWDDTQAKAGQDYITDWHVIGPFKGTEKGKVNLDVKTPFEDDFTKQPDAAIDLKAAYKIGDASLKWKPVQASTKNGLVDLARALGATDYCVAYAVAEVESIHARETVLRCGSDDGIMIWLNGKVVHSMEAMRGYSPNSDEAPIYLKAGVNRIVVKITNLTAGWGFGVAVPKANF